MDINHTNDLSQTQNSSPPYFSPDSHALNVGIATVTKSVNAALVFNHIFFWLKENKQKGRHIHEGRTWMYDTIPAIAYHFPYLSDQQVKDALAILVQHKYLIKGNFSKNKFDRTNWYALSNEEWLGNQKKFTKVSMDPMDSVYGADPLLIYQTDNNTDNISSDLAVGLASSFFEKLQKINPKIKPPDFDKWAKEFDLMIKRDKRSPSDISSVIDFIISTHGKPSSNGFCWANVVLSPAALREKFAMLWAQMQSQPTKKAPVEEKTEVEVIEKRRSSTKDFIKDKWEKSKELNVYIADRVSHVCIGEDKINYDDKEFKEKFLKSAQRHKLL